MAVIPVSALPGRRRDGHGGRWGQLGSRDPFVQPIRGVDRFLEHPRAQFRSQAYTDIPEAPARPAPYFSGQQRDSLPQQAQFRSQVLDIIKIDYGQRTHTNQGQFQASAATVPSRVPPVPLRIYLPEPDAPYPIPFQPVKIGRLPPENGARAGHSNPHFSLPRREQEARVPLSGGAFTLYGGRRRSYRRPRASRQQQLHRGGVHRRKRRLALGRGRAAVPLRPCAPCALLGGRPVGGAYRRPYDSPDRIERPGERAWQVNAIPVPERARSSAPVLPPAWAETPRVALAPPRVRDPLSLPRAAYLPRAAQQDALYSVWNQPVSFQMPAVVGPDYPSQRFSVLRDEQLQGYRGSGSGRAGGFSWSDKDERMYRHIKQSELARGMNVHAAERVAASTVNRQRQREGRLKF